MFTLICIYGFNYDRPDLLIDISNELSNFQADAYIFGGDFNFVFNIDLDKKGGQPRTNFKARNKCLTLMSTYDLIDVWRERNPLSYSHGAPTLPPVYTVDLIFS